MEWWTMVCRGSKNEKVVQQCQDRLKSWGAVKFKSFQPKMLLESGYLHVSLNDAACVVKSTGGSVQEEDEIHLWHFGNKGLVTRFGHKCDTQQHWSVFRVE